jgi:hypothetical protein
VVAKVATVRQMTIRKKLNRIAIAAWRLMETEPSVLLG